MKWKNNSTYKLIGIIVALILLVIFILQNTENVTLKIFFFPKIPLPSALLIIISMIIGFLFGFLGAKIIARKKCNDEDGEQ
ncbi:MAG: lipopolysaccharide assembly protein LapA domain-containing protein [bacterium]